jgi:hypothetical protein
MDDTDLQKLVEQGEGTSKNFKKGTIVFTRQDTLYDKDDMYEITEKYGPYESCYRKNYWNGTNDILYVDNYFYDLKKIVGGEIKEKTYKVFEIENVILNGKLQFEDKNKNINKHNINNELNGKEIIKIVKDEGKYNFVDGKGHVPERKDQHLITFNDNTTAVFTGELTKPASSGGKRTLRRRKSKKARKSRRKGRKSSR